MLRLSRITGGCDNTSDKPRDSSCERGYRVTHHHRSAKRVRGWPAGGVCSANLSDYIGAMSYTGAKVSSTSTCLFDTFQVPTTNNLASFLLLPRSRPGGAIITI